MVNQAGFAGSGGRGFRMADCGFGGALKGRAMTTFGPVDFCLPDFRTAGSRARADTADIRLTLAIPPTGF